MQLLLACFVWQSLTALGGADGHPRPNIPNTIANKPIAVEVLGLALTSTTILLAGGTVMGLLGPLTLGNGKEEPMHKSFVASLTVPCSVLEDASRARRLECGEFRSWSKLAFTPVNLRRN